jgi:hypothetical protein
MSAAKVGGDVKSNASDAARDGLSRALSSALEKELLRPLIDLVAGYARTADWSRVTVDEFKVTPDLQYPSAVLIDHSLRRVLWVEVHDVKAATFSDLNACVVSDAKSKSVAAVQVAGPFEQRHPLAADRCLYGPSDLAFEPVTHWPNDDFAGAETAAADLPVLSGRVGAGAL